MTNDDPVRDALGAFIDARVDARIEARLASLTKPAVDEYLTTQAAAKIAGVSVYTIRRWIRARHLLKHLSGSRVRVRRAELERYISGAPAQQTPAERARRKFG